MRRILALFVLVAAGCSTAPVADFLDLVAPGCSDQPSAAHDDPPPLPPRPPVPSDFRPVDPDDEGQTPSSKLRPRS